MGAYATYQTDLLPVPLRGPWGEAWGSCFGLIKDVYTAGAIQAVTARFAQTAPEDALGFIGEERLLPQNPGETISAYRARLLAAPTLWQWAGTKFGLLTALHYLGFPNVEVYESADWPDYGDPAVWWKFWVVLRAPHGFGEANWYCGDGSLCGAPGLICGFRSVPIAHPSIRPTIARWKPAHAMLISVIIVMNGDICGGGWLCGDGTVCGGSTATT